MQAIVQTAAEPRSISVEERPRPEPADREVLVDVHTSGVCGSDVGAYLYKEGYKWVPTPRVMGHEYSGTVVKLGSAVTEFAVGDHVVEEPIRHCGQCYYCQSGNQNICDRFEITGMHHDGAWQESVTVPERHLHPVPDGVSLRNAALAEPLSVAARTVLDQSRISVGDTVIVEGPGPIGVLSAQVARQAGARVLVAGVDPDEKYRLPLVETMGFETINVQQESLVERVEALSDGRGADVVIDATGHRSGMESGLECVRKGGQVVMVGLPNESAEVFFTDAVRAEIEIQTSYASRWDNFEQAFTLLANGGIDAETFIDERYSFTDPETALEAFVAGETTKPVFSFQ